MRIYRLDGTFVENPNDADFGWYFSDIIKDNHNKIKCDEKKECVHSTKPSIEESFLESIVVIEPEKPVSVKKIDINIKTEHIVNVLDCKMEIEGVSVKANEPKLLRELKNINVTLPPREKLASLVSPCNTETKTLLSVLYFAKYKSLLKNEASDELFRSVNFKTTNFKHLINEKESDLRQEMCKEIENYHATKEDNMLSLMMELILTDVDCNLEDIVDVNQASNECTIPQFVIETSDLGNSIQSSYSSKDENPDKSNYLQVPNRSDILSSLGLSDSDKSIQSFCEETFEMHLQLEDIKESFSEEETRINELIKMAVALQKELKETLYLDDILHLLRGDIEKVTFKKLPFRIFHKSKEHEELNFII